MNAFHVSSKQNFHKCTVYKITENAFFVKIFSI